MADCFEIRNLSVPVNTLLEVLPRVFETIKFRPVGASMQPNGIYRQTFISTLPSFVVFRSSKPQLVTAIVRPQKEDLIELELQFNFDTRFRWAVRLANIGSLILLACVIVGFLSVPIDYIRSHGGLFFPSLVCLMGLPVWIWLWLWTRLKSFGGFCDTFYGELRKHILPGASLVARQLEHPENAAVQTLSFICVLVGVATFILTHNELSKTELLSYLAILLYAGMIIAPLLKTKIPFERSLSVLMASLVTLCLATYSFGAYSFFAVIAQNGSNILSAIDRRQVESMEAVSVFLALTLLVLAGIIAVPYLCVRPLKETIHHLKIRKGQPIRISETMSTFPIGFRFAMALMWIFCFISNWGIIIASLGLIERMVMGHGWVIHSTRLDIWFSDLLMVADIFIPQNFGPVYVHALRSVLLIGIVLLPLLGFIRILVANAKTAQRWFAFRYDSRSLNQLSGDNWEKIISKVCSECLVGEINVYLDERNKCIQAAMLDSPFPGMRPILYLSKGAIQLNATGELWILIAHELGHLVKKHSWKYSMMRFISRWTVAGNGFFDCFLKSPILTELEADDFAVERFDAFHKSKHGFRVFEQLMESLDTQQNIEQINNLRPQGLAIHQDLNVVASSRDHASRFSLWSLVVKLPIELRLIDQMLFGSASVAYVYADKKTRVAMLRSRHEQKLST